MLIDVSNYNVSWIVYLLQFLAYNFSAVITSHYLLKQLVISFIGQNKILQTLSLTIVSGYLKTCSTIDPWELKFFVQFCNFLC